MNRNNRFERVDSGSSTPVAGRGAAFGDLNNDGWQDVVMTYLGGHPQVFMNRGGKQHWLVISLRGTRSNRDGFGARVKVNGQTRFATSAGSYASSSDKRLHFGMGAMEKANVEIFWPSGIHQTLNDVHADQFLEVREPEKQ
jgi:enediyne biosynthesis protein E4